jgi:hypothetical protein
MAHAKQNADATARAAHNAKEWTKEHAENAAHKAAEAAGVVQEKTAEVRRHKTLLPGK